jgi:hypothetical protein
MNRRGHFTGGLRTRIAALAFLILLASAPLVNADVGIFDLGGLIRDTGGNFLRTPTLRFRYTNAAACLQ